MRMRRVGSALAVVLCLVAAAAGCGSSGKQPGASPSSGYVDQPVTFQAGGVTVYATYRHPQATTGSVPAVLLIAGSGPTDRNGNSMLEAGTVGTLQTLADWLSADGVASLRYDKLGTGQTGLGSYASNPDNIGIEPFEQEAAGGLNYLAAQPHVDRARLGVIGHSEGALYALLLATGMSGQVPPVHALGLVEPLSDPELTLIQTQIAAALTSEQTSGQIPAARAATLQADLATAISTIRSTGRDPADLPKALASSLPASSALYLQQTDAFDPAALAAKLPAHTPVLVSCSNADVQVSCAEVARVRTGLTHAGAATDFVQLTGVDHVLKEDPTGSAANYTKPLPFSTQLQSALAAFTRSALGATGG